MNIDFSEAWKGLREMGNSFLERLPAIGVALVVFLLFYLAAKVLRRVLLRITARRKRRQNVGLVLGRLAQGGVVFLGLLVALVIALPTFKPAQLVSLLGISSVAIGFAFRDILQNFLAGILLLWNEPFRLGDQICMGNFEGQVEEIDTRATMIRTYDGRRIVIPNGDLYTTPVTVNTAYEKRRLECDVGIGYGDDIAQAKAVIHRTLRELQDVLSEPAPEVLVVEFGPSSVNLRVRWWITPPTRSDYMHSRDTVLSAIKPALSAAGIDLPFPTQHILFHDQTEETDGDRSRQREGWPAGKGPVPRSRAIAKALQRRLPPTDGAKAQPEGDGGESQAGA